jgi:subtilisin family serine protease
MEEARLSQQKLVADLAPLTQTQGGEEAPVAGLHSLWLVNRLVVTATPEVIERLVDREDVEAIRLARAVRLVEPARERGPAPDDAGAGRGKTTYGLAKIRAPQAWSELAINGSGVVVGHLDTGVYARHKDLANKIVKFKDFFGHDQEEAFDGMGHGTHTAGTIVGGNASGKAIGVAPGAKLIVGRIFNAQGVTTDAIVLRAMNWVADPDGDPQTADGPRLVSNSWGGPQESETPGGELWDAVQRWVDLGILPVFAAGNSGPRGKVGTPAAYPHALAVGSTNWFNWASLFSSRGPSRWDGAELTKPDVCAPGSSVESAKDRGGYTTMSGTSMACPHAAGVAALMYQANPNLTVPQAVEIMRSTAKDLGSNGKDNTYGWGLLDAVKAVDRARALATFERASE